MTRRSRIRTVFLTATAVAAFTLAPLPASATTPERGTAELALLDALGSKRLSEGERDSLIAEWREAVESLRADVDLLEGERDVERVTLSNGMVMEVGAEPVPLAASDTRAGLSGRYRIWGNNGLFGMEYYVDYARVSGNTAYTRVVSAHSMTVSSWAGASWDGKWFNIPRPVESHAGGAWVQGLTKLTYPGGVWTGEGGVDAIVYRGNLSAYLN